MLFLSLKKKILLLFLNFFNHGCVVHQIVAARSTPAEQEVIYLRRTDSTKPPIVIGQVNALEADAKKSSVASAIISIDNVIALANEHGNYSLPLLPGTHSMVVGQIGFYKSKTVLKVSSGDSIRANFNLRYDLRPTTN